MKRCYYCMSEIESDHKSTCPHCGKKFSDKRQSERFLQPGTVLYNKFIVGHPIGYGGFGNTYIGWDQLLCRKVAIKEYYPEQFCFRAEDGVTISNNGGKFEERFERGLHQFLEEARNVATLHDIKGVVKISNFFEANGTGYIVMEYLEGMDVKSILKNEGQKKDFEWSRRVILTVLYTLREIHARGVLHRDIAPDNIFVTNEGVIKLIDFGAAKHSSNMEIEGDIILKKGYSPIEQYSRSIPQGPYTDLYGVAALFYRMITGQRPMPANERAINDGLLAPSDMGIELPGQAEAAIMICLSVNPKYRLQSADEFMEALEGKDFVPVYEPDWILPKVKDNNSIGNILRSMPISVKIALGACVVLIIAGVALSMYAYRSTKQTEVATANSATLISLQGKSFEEAEELLDSINSQYGMNLSLVEDKTVYSSDEDLDGCIEEQSVPAGTDLEDKSAIEALDNSNLSYDEDGVLTGEIHCNLYTNEYITYEELNGVNAYRLSQILGIEITDQLFQKAEEKKGDKKKYWTMKDIILDGGKTIIKASDFEEASNASKTITVEDISEIEYYGSEFFYWTNLPDFKESYGTKDELKKETFSVYTYVDETERKSESKKKLSDSMLDDGYISLSSDYPKGKIVGQTIKANKEYDGSQNDDLKIKIIGTQIDTSGLTANELKNKIEEIAPKVEINVTNGDNSISDITIHNTEGDTVKYFKNLKKVTIDIVGEEPAPEPTTKKSTKKKSSSKNKSSGSNKSNKSSGGFDGSWY